MQKLLVTPEEAADLLSVGRTTVYDLLKTGALVSVKIGRSRRVTYTALQRYVEQLPHRPKYSTDLAA